MRWDTLFADLERYFEDSSARQRGTVASSRDESEADASRDRDLIVTFSRLRSERRPVSITLIDGSSLELTITAVGVDWVSGERLGRDPSTVITPLSGLVSLDLPRRLPVRPQKPGLRVTLSEALRVWSRTTLTVTVRTVGSVDHGAIASVGLDYFDLDNTAVASRGHLRRIRISTVCWISLGGVE